MLIFAFLLPKIQVIWIIINIIKKINGIYARSTWVSRVSGQTVHPDRLRGPEQQPFDRLRIIG